MNLALPCILQDKLKYVLYFTCVRWRARQDYQKYVLYFSLRRLRGSNCSGQFVEPCSHPASAGAPGRIRTCDPPLRRRMLYPTELRAPVLHALFRTLDNSLTVVQFARFKKSCGRKRCRLELVGVEGFEPPTFCSQSRRATRLRYTPKPQDSRGVHDTDGVRCRQRLHNINF